VPSQRFEGLAGAAEAVVKSDRSCWESQESRFFLFLLGQPAEIGGQLAKNLVAVEKRNQSSNFAESERLRRTNIQQPTNEISSKVPRKEFFNSHEIYLQLTVLVSGWPTIRELSRFASI
jgi:hypothetical protein